MKTSISALRLLSTITLAIALTACDGFIFAGRPAPEAEPLDESIYQNKEQQTEAIAFAEKFYQKAYASELEEYWPEVRAYSQSTPAWELAKGFDVNRRLFGAVISRQLLRIEPDPPLKIYVVFKVDFEKASAEESLQLLQEGGTWKIGGFGIANIREKQ